ncbi:MAG: cell division protein [Alcaligenaceae bacterium]|nr:MAG: cell division protein [Alcaligenaceae bacterium]
MVKRKSSGSGSTLYGVLAGLLIGLVAAVVVAFYVIKSPMPFVDKASRSPEASSATDPRHAPDPNAGLAGRTTGPVTAPSSPEQPSGETAAKTVPREGAAPDALGALIATLTPTPGAQAPAPRVVPRAEPAPSAPSTSGNPVGGPYFLQVGSFRVLEDAEALRARIILMGMPVEIQRAEVNGLQVNRVRVGPFAKIDDMNQTRTRLGQEKIPTAVVRQ